MSATPQIPMSRIAEWFHKIEREIRLLREQMGNLFAGSGLAVVDTGQVAQTAGMTITSGGTLEVDGGDVVMIDQAPLATVLFRLGTQEFGDRGITLYRNDGSTAVEVKNSFSPTDARQSFILRDPSGRAIAGDSNLADSGFDAPHVPIPFVPVDPTASGRAVTTSATTFTATHEHRGFRQNPALKLQVAVQCSDATTAAEVQVWDALNSTYLGGFLGSPATLTITVPAGTTTFTVFEVPSALALPGLMSDDMRLEIHVRRTAGTGTVTVAPARSIGGGF